MEGNTTDSEQQNTKQSESKHEETQLSAHP
jgi:hypothetical protein